MKQHLQQAAAGQRQLTVVGECAVWSLCCMWSLAAVSADKAMSAVQAQSLRLIISVTTLPTPSLQTVVLVWVV